MKFTNLPEFSEYNSFGIIAEKGTHTICNVTFVINPNDAEEYLLIAEQRKSIEIFSNSGDRVMNGLVSAVVVNYGVTSTTAEVTIISESVLLQEKGEERIFQNPVKTYADILKAFSDVEVGKCEHLNDTIEEIIYQHRMNDFSFLLYLAGRCGTGLWITEEGKVSFGRINSVKSLSDTETVYQKSILEKKIKADKDKCEINLLTMEQMPNGSLLRQGQSEYVICNVYVHEKCDETYFRYIGLTKPDYDTTAEKTETLITKARVTDNKDPETLGRIQVEFIEFTDNSSKKTWIPYLTTFVGKHNSGVVMIPDIDDEVIICISDGVPFVINSVRKERIPENCQDIDVKHIAIKNSVITIDENAIIAMQGDKTKSSMTHESIIFEHDKSQITLDDNSAAIEREKSKITVYSNNIQSKHEKSAMTVTSDKIVVENNKGKLAIDGTSVVLESGKSKLSLNNGKTELGGSNIDLSTQGGSL